MLVMCDKCKTSEKIFALWLDKNRTSTILLVRYRDVYRNAHKTAESMDIFWFQKWSTVCEISGSEGKISSIHMNFTWCTNQNWKWEQINNFDWLRTSKRDCFSGFRTFRQKMFRQKQGGGRFGKKNVPKRLRLKTFAETFRMISGAYPVYARSPSPSQRPSGN